MTFFEKEDEKDDLENEAVPYVQGRDGTNVPATAQGTDDSSSKKLNKNAEGMAGVSNTPAMTYQKGGIETLIDYLKVRIDLIFNPSDPENRGEWTPLLNALFLNPNEYVELRGASNYERGYRFGENIFLWTRGNLTRNSAGQETSLLEIKGAGCREVEQIATFANLPETPHADPLGPSFVKNVWRNIFREISKLPHYCTRIDLPTDDIGGLVPLDELKKKIERKEYTSSFRSLSLEHDAEKDSREDITALVHIKNHGWSATFGSRDLQELVIYDKKAEMTKGFYSGICLVSSWVRYEVRYFHDRADKVFSFLALALESQNPLSFQAFVVGCLDSCICFRDKRLDGNNTYKAKIWKKWTNFVSKGNILQLNVLVRGASTLKQNAIWLEKDACRMFSRVVAVYPHDVISIVRYFCSDGIAKMNNEDLSVVNTYLIDHGEEPYADLDQLRLEVFNDLGLENLPPDKINQLFDDKPLTYLTKISRNEGGNF